MRRLTAFIGLGLLLISSAIFADVVTLHHPESTSLHAPPLIIASDKDVNFTPSENEIAALVPWSEGEPRTSLWYKFEINNRTNETQWFITPTNTVIESISLIENQQVLGKQNGYFKKYPFDLSNGVTVTLASNQITTLWLHLESPYVANNLLFTLDPKTEYLSYHFNHSALVLVALGAMLALIIYNTFLYFPTRDSSFIWYPGYQLLCTFCWAAQFKVLVYSFDLELNQSNFYFPFFMAGATSLMFAITFLRLRPASKLNFAIRALAIGLVVVGTAGLFLPFYVYSLMLYTASYLWMSVMLGLGIMRYNQGYRPARFYVIGFAIMFAILILNLISSVTQLNFFKNQILWALWAQLIDSIALALALADRINFLRKSRQFADKRATTDQLTQLPNRMAFERDVRAWEAYCKEGIFNDFYLTFIDVDGLKEVNDYQGHNEGDRLLLVVGEWLRQKINGQNVYRIGGDEFVVLSKQRIDWDISDLHDNLDSNGFSKSDLSMGTSSFKECGNRSKLLSLADERMYITKKKNKAKLA